MRKVTLPVAGVALDGDARAVGVRCSPRTRNRSEAAGSSWWRSTTSSDLDNSQAVDSIDYNMVAGALYEGLYHFTPEGELEPGLADGLPEVSDDGLVYTFHLKPGAMFAGPDFEPRAVTAADVAYGMTRALDPTPVGAAGPSWGAGYLAHPRRRGVRRLRDPARGRGRR